MRQIYESQLFFFLRVEDYEHFITTQDYAVGYRVHGVLPALANGLPGILFRYDTRSSELADTHAIPSFTPEDIHEFGIKKLFERVSFEGFNKIFSVKYDRMKSVLDANAIPNLM